MRITSLFLLFILSTPTFCFSAQDPAATAKVENSPAINTWKTIPSFIVETPAQALWYWKSSSRLTKKTKLIILSNDPYLTPVPQKNWSKALHFLEEQDQEKFFSSTRTPIANPPILPSMPLDLALRAGMFTEVLWVFPISPRQKALGLDAFLNQLKDSYSLTPSEAKTFRETEGCFSGEARGIKLTACPSTATLPDLSGESTLHLDISYFAHSYSNEIKSKLYPLVYETLRLLYKAGLESRRATISPSNTTGGVSLRTRFLASDVSSLLLKPQRLEKPLPDLWYLRGQNFFLDVLFQSERVMENLNKMMKLAPADPAVHYAMYEGKKAAKKGNEALEELAAAVAIDPIYAYEYLQLANLAMEKGRPHAAMSMMRKATLAQPQDPFLKLAELKLMLDTRQDKDLIKDLARGIQNLPWDPVYDPEIKNQMSALLKKLKESGEGMQEEKE